MSLLHSWLLPFTWVWGTLTTTRYARLHSWLRRTLAELAPGAAVLDVGCGTGALLAPWSERTPHLQWTGLDRAADALAALEKYLSARGHLTVQLHPLDVNEPAAVIPHVEGGYSLIVCAAMLQYVAEPGALLAKLASSLHPAGAILLYVPVNYHRLLHGYDAVIARYFSTVDYDQQQAIRHRLTVEQVESLAKHAGLTVVQRERVTGWPGQLQYELHTLLYYATQAWLWPLPILVAFLPVGFLLLGLDRIHGRRYPGRRGNGLLARLERTR